MALFGFGKKKEEVQPVCDCGGACEPKRSEREEKGCCCRGDSNSETEKDAERSSLNNSAKADAPTVKILGSGCAKCNQLEAATKEALTKLGMDTTVDHVTDFAQIAAYGVMSTPALVVDGKVVSYSKVLKTEEVLKLIEKSRG